MKLIVIPVAKFLTNSFELHCSPALQFIRTPKLEIFPVVPCYGLPWGKILRYPAKPSTISHSHDLLYIYWQVVVLKKERKDQTSVSCLLTCFSNFKHIRTHCVWTFYTQIRCNHGQLASCGQLTERFRDTDRSQNVSCTNVNSCHSTKGNYW